VRASSESKKYGEKFLKRCLDGRDYENSEYFERIDNDNGADNDDGKDSDGGNDGNNDGSEKMTTKMVTSSLVKMTSLVKMKGRGIWKD
jgi:hypothetical protein